MVNPIIRKRILSLFKRLVKFIIAVAILILCIPIIEAKIKTEICSLSSGDCRIVNTAKSIDEHLELRMYRYSNEPNKRHIIAVDDNGNIVDLSRLSPENTNQSINGKKLSFFENRNENKPILEYIYTKDGQEKYSNINIETFIETFSVIYYLKVFRYFYN